MGFFFVFVFEAEILRVRSHLLVHFLNVIDSWESNPGLSHGRQESRYLSHHSCHPGSALAGSCFRTWSWELNPGTLMHSTGILTRLHACSLLGSWPKLTMKKLEALLVQWNQETLGLWLIYGINKKNKPYYYNKPINRVSKRKKKNNLLMTY